MSKLRKYLIVTFSVFFGVLLCLPLLEAGGVFEAYPPANFFDRWMMGLIFFAVPFGAYATVNCLLEVVLPD